MRRSSSLAAFLIVLALAAAASAQEAPPPPEDPHAGMTMPMDHDMGMPMGEASTFPMRDASGTAWLPDNTPMFGLMKQARGWDVMFHGNLFVEYINEFAPIHRGSDQFGSINWFMADARRNVGSGRLGIRTMLSLEPWTVGTCGYPDLLATGEFCDGDNIHDRQHPHDLFMELAAEYDRPITDSVRFQIYGGPAAEPALGPAAFPHRPSAMANPIAPITHHWLDATHVSFGVVTGGVYGATWKAEASVFNGREPDERRTDFDFGALDSVSARVWWLPAPALAMQISTGYLNGAEQLIPGGARVDIRRSTASLTYHRGSTDRWFWASTAAWGTNLLSGTRTHGVLFESTVTNANRDAWFGRVEINGKLAHDLHIHGTTEIFTVQKAQIGYTRYLSAWKGMQPGAGGYLSAGFVPDEIEGAYGGVGTGIGIFVTLRPAAHGM